MKKLTIGKLRGLQQLTTPDGMFTICAMDHRDSLRNMIDREHVREVGYEEMVQRKLELCSNLAPYSSAVLLDPEYGAARCISAGAIPGDTGILVSIETSGFIGDKEHRLNKLLDDWGVKKIKGMGASAVKMLVYYRPDLQPEANKQLKTVNKVAAECIKYDLPFVVEPVSYAIGTEAKNPQEFAIKKEELVIKTAKDITSLPVDVLKAEFPADSNYRKDKGELIELCRRLDEASHVPWIILSRGVDFEMFYQQVEIACRGGASGFLGGRAIWQEAMSINNTEERTRYLSTVGVDRLKRLAEITVKYATPWYKKLGLTCDHLANVTEDWYKEYQKEEKT